ncbi:potassium transporter TrkA [Sulfurimonas aquatica]|uniref:BK channel n=1 Tax=Sulfurimonas aquatica TaxID=2672570 RepID=A0A975GE53_9BACT|nr:potassium transporter TrkA [Sulfurimonas aquatica]
MIIDGAYYLQTSKAYQAKKVFFYNLLENNQYKYKKYVDIFMVTLIFISVAVLIREVKHEVPDYLRFFSSYVVSIIFFIEYILRLWINSSVTSIIVQQADHNSFLSQDLSLFKVLKKILYVKLKYIFSIRAIIDLLAVLPFFHELRLLRVFILFRIFKLFRYARSFQMLIGVLQSKKFEFITLGVFASIVIFVSSILIYVMEANNTSSAINTLFEAVYWSIVTISTVGYGDVTPVTTEGRVVAMLVITAGIAVLAFTTSLVVSAFTEKLDEIKEVKTIEDINKLKRFYLVCGYESVAKEVTRKLLLQDSDIIVLDIDPLRIENARNDGLTVLPYDPGSIESYKKLNIDIKKQVKAILCLREDDVQNVYTALTVRSLDKDIFILSLLINDVNRKKLLFAGINNLVYPQELVGLMTKEFIGKPVAFEVIHELRSESNNVNIAEIAVTERIVENYPIVGEFGNKNFRVIILGVYKHTSDRFLFNPIDSTFLEVGDYIIAIGYDVFIKEFENHLDTKAKNG